MSNGIRTCGRKDIYVPECGDDLEGRVEALEECCDNVHTALDGKVDKEDGKGLSSNDYTDSDAAKLSGIEAGAEVNPPSGTQSDLSTGTSTVDMIWTAKILHDYLEARIQQIPADQFLDLNQTEFVNPFTWSAVTYPGSIDPNLDGKPVLVLALTDGTNVAYSFLNMEDLIDTYTGTSPIVVSGSTISHANSGVTAGAYGDTSNQTPAFGSTFKSISQTVNATGHTTVAGEHTVKIPDTLATTTTRGLMSPEDKIAVSDTEYIEDTEPYLFRKTGGNTDIGNAIAEYDTLIGASVVVNQLVENGDFSNGTTGWSLYHITCSVSGNEAAVTTTDVNAQLYQASKSYIANHVYLVTAKAKSSDTITLRFYDGHMQFNGVVLESNYKPLNYVFKPSSAYTANFALLATTYTAGAGYVVKDVQIIDLTALFGSASIPDHAYTLEQNQAGSGIAWLKSYGFITKPYYPYNAGALQSVKTSKHKMVGFNQWDEEWELGQFNNSTGQPYPNNNCIRSKNFIPVLPNTSYYTTYGVGNMQVFFYGADDAFISQSWVGATNIFSIPSNCYKMKFRNASSYGTTYNHDICINLSKTTGTPKNGDYLPYESVSYPLDNVELRGVAKLVGNEIKYDGDVYEAGGTVTRKYGYRAYEAGDESLANAITDGTHTVYKLNTPTTETADPFTSPQTIFADGTEEYIDNRTAPIPVGHETKYPSNMKDKLKSLPWPAQSNGQYVIEQNNGFMSLAPFVAGGLKSAVLFDTPEEVDYDAPDASIALNPLTDVFSGTIHSIIVNWTWEDSLGEIGGGIPFYCANLIQPEIIDINDSPTMIPAIYQPVSAYLMNAAAYASGSFSLHFWITDDNGDYTMEVIMLDQGGETNWMNGVNTGITVNLLSAIALYE